MVGPTVEVARGTLCPYLDWTAPTNTTTTSAEAASGASASVAAAAATTLDDALSSMTFSTEPGTYVLMGFPELPTSEDLALIGTVS